MRNAFFKVLEKKFQENKDLIVLTGDLGFKLFDNFKSHDPNRFYDVGVAEANLVSLSSGLALTGKKPYCYSIVPFLVMRAFEQVRIDVALANANVKLIGAGGGFTYGLEGFTHWALEDVSLMRSLPNMSVVVPADSLEAEQMAALSLSHEGPMYIRLGKTGEPKVHTSTPSIKLGKALILEEGVEIAIFANGSMVYTACQVAEKLKAKGVKPTLVNIHTIKPLDEQTILSIAKSHRSIYTIEEHYIYGGLGSAVAEVLAENGFAGKFKRFGVHHLNMNFVGDVDHLRKKYHLTPDHVYTQILEFENK